MAKPSVLFRCFGFGRHCRLGRSLYGSFRLFHPSPERLQQQRGLPRTAHERLWHLPQDDRRQGSARLDAQSWRSHLGPVVRGRSVVPSQSQEVFVNEERMRSRLD